MSGEYEADALCRVCQLLDGDESFKRCRWCETCGVWICLADWGNALRRARAAIVSRL